MTLGTPLVEEESADSASTSSNWLYKVGLVVVASCVIWASTLLMGPGSVEDETTTNSDQDESALLGDRVTATDTDQELESDSLVVNGTLVPRDDDSDEAAVANDDAVITGGDSISASPASETTAGGDGSGSDSDMPDSSTTTPSTTGPSGESSNPPSAAPGNGSSNLKMILASSTRNTNHDNSPHIATPSAQLNLSDHYGPRSDYVASRAGNDERAYPVANGGQFRAGCEFSHFSYDDPLIFPNQPGASHLHMHFGNTHVNAFTTFDSLLNSGSSTCNGQELNRTGYWVPALFDGNGNVRVPERVVIYYKGEGLARGNSQVYPDGAAIIAEKNLNTAPASEGGAPGKMTFVCSDNRSTNTGIGSHTMPNCDGSRFTAPGRRTVLEMNVKFPQCWNGKDAGNYKNFRPPSGPWYGSNCSGEYNQTFPNLEYFVNYVVEPGENTSNWFLSSDVDATAFGSNKKPGGTTTHGDWWGGWNKEVANMWIKNCVNYRTSAPSGCGFGYLTDGGPSTPSPYDGPALKMRPEYTGPNKVAAGTIFKELCPNSGRNFNRAEDAAYCTPK